MAVSSLDIRARVRRRVQDYTEPYAYSDDFYNDAIRRATSRINLDLATSYSIDVDFPDKFAYLIELRTTIELCYIRGGETASVDADSQTASFSVPGLSVSSKSTGSEYWVSLAERLEEEYGASLPPAIDEEDGIDPLGIREGYMYRTSLRTGARTQRYDDDAIVLSGVSLVVSQGVVNIEYDRARNPHLSSVLLYRDVNANMTTAKQIQTNTDPVLSSFTDAPSGAVLFYYQIETVSTNDIRWKSQILGASLE